MPSSSEQYNANDDGSGSEMSVSDKSDEELASTSHNAHFIQILWHDFKFAIDEAKMDRFTYLQGFIEHKLVFSTDNDYLQIALHIGKFLTNHGAHLSDHQLGMVKSYLGKSCFFLSNATDEQWKFKEMKCVDSVLLELTLYSKELAQLLHERAVVDDSYIAKIDEIQLGYLLKLIQFAKLYGRTSAVDEMYKLFHEASLTGVSYPRELSLNISRSFDGLVSWFRSSDVLSALLRDNLHITTFVDRIERVFQILIQKEVFREEDLDIAWAAQWGKHDAVQRNMHHMISKLARFMNMRLIDRLFALTKESFQQTQSTREKTLLLEFCRSLIANQNSVYMAPEVNEKAFRLTWDLYHDPNMNLETIEMLLSVQEGIINSAKNPDALRREGFINCMNEIRQNSELAQPLFQHLKSFVVDSTERRRKFSVNAFSKLIIEQDTIAWLIRCIVGYLDDARKFVLANGGSLPIEDVDVCLCNSRFPHSFQVTIRMDALSFFLNEVHEQYSPTLEDMEKLWQAMIENPVSEFERLRGFNFFGLNVSKFDNRTLLAVLNDCLFSFSPVNFTINSFNEICNVFTAATATMLTESPYSLAVTGGVSPAELRKDYMQKVRDYLWKVILDAPENVVHRAIEFFICEMEDMKRVETRNDCAGLFINECFLRLHNFDLIIRQTASEDARDQAALRAQRVVKALKLLLVRYENQFHNRLYPPLYRATMGRCFKCPIVISRDEGKVKSADSRKTIAVNSNWMMRHFCQQICNMVISERACDSHGTEKIEVLCYQVPPGLTMQDAHVRVMPMMQTLRAERFPTLSTGMHADMLRYVGSQSMKKTLNELHVNEMTLFIVRVSRGRRDSTGYGFVRALTHGDIPDVHASLEYDEELYGSDTVHDESFEMPSIILARERDQVYFLMDLADLAHQHNKASLRDEIAHLCDHLTVTDEFMQEFRQAMDTNSLRQLMITPSPTRSSYFFQAVHSLLTPVVFDEIRLKLEVRFLETNSIFAFFEMLESAFLNDKAYYPAITARILLSFVRIIKFVSNACKKKQAEHLTHIASMEDEFRSEDNFFDNYVYEINRLASTVPEFHFSLENADNYVLPMVILKSLMFTAWSASRCNISGVAFRSAPPTCCDGGGDSEVMETCSTDSDSSYSSNMVDESFYAKIIYRHDSLCETLAVEALDAFLEAAPFCSDVPQLFHTPAYLLGGQWTITEQSTLNPSFYEFCLDGMLHSSSELVRAKMMKAFQVMLQAFPETAGEPGPSANAMLDILFANLSLAEQSWIRASQYFLCLFHLLDYCQREEIVLRNADEKFYQVIKWLDAAKSATHDNGLTVQREELLNYYLKTAMHVLRLKPPKFRLGLGIHGINFLQDLFDDFLIPFSKALHALSMEESLQCANMGNGSISPANSDASSVVLKPNKAMPICRSETSIKTCFNLICDIIRDVPENLEQVLTYISNTFYADCQPYICFDMPPVFLQRDPVTFVGLKNAGATCYMNSVLQQLFMIEPFREMIMNAKCRKFPQQTNADNSIMLINNKQANDYADQLIYSVQAMFANLLASDEQYYTPLDFWDTFQFGGRDVNIREQQDAVEFFNALADGLDESLKKIGETPVFEKLFGGTFADQKKCRDCPHMFEKEQLFTSIAVDVRSHNNLTASLNEYVTGDLLEGDNAYFCELCSKKVTAVKRLCIAKLPPFLMFQLKRFDMDWNRGLAVKFFDYFEFPAIIDMEPFTSNGVARREGTDGTAMESSTSSGGGLFCATNEGVETTKYRLRGVVVHSGEAHGGHYYSYIADNREDGKQQWYRFDDMDVTAWDYNECESRVQWFGGYNDEQYRSEKDRRRFSAYMLVYEAIPNDSSILQQVSAGTNRSVSAHSPSPPCLPSPNVNCMDMYFGSMSLHSRRSTANRLPSYWERIVTKNNLRFSHERFQYSVNFFRFIRDITRFAALQCRQGVRQPVILARRALHVLSCFLFTTGLRSSADLRQTNLKDWGSTFDMLLEVPTVAAWYLQSHVTQNNILQCCILQNHTTGDMKKLIDKIYFSPLSLCMRAADEKLNLMAPDEADFIADNTIKRILAVTKTHSLDFWTTGGHVLQVLANIASESVFAARRLVRQNALSTLLFAFSFRDEVRVRMFCRETPHFFSLIGILLTSCSSLQKPHNNNASRPVLNPYARECPEVFYVPDNVIAWMSPNQANMNVTRFFQFMLETQPASPEIFRIVNYICWNSLPNSCKLIACLPFGASDNIIKTTLAMFNNLIKIPDDFQVHRIQAVCLGKEGSKIRGLLTEVVFAAEKKNLERVLPLVIALLQAFGDNGPKMRDALFAKETFGRYLHIVRNFFNQPEAQIPKSSYLSVSMRDYVPILQDIVKKWNVLCDEYDASVCSANAEEEADGATTQPKSPDSLLDPLSPPPSQVVPRSSLTGTFHLNTLNAINARVHPTTNDRYSKVESEIDDSIGASPPPAYPDGGTSKRALFSSPANSPEGEDEVYGAVGGEDGDDELNGRTTPPDGSAMNVSPIYGTPTKASSTTGVGGGTVKAGKKRHFDPPTHGGSNSSLPSYEMSMSQPTSRKLRHEQSPHTSPVKFHTGGTCTTTTVFPEIPTYEECVKSAVSPMQTGVAESPPSYTGNCSSDNPPSV